MKLVKIKVKIKNKEFETFFKIEENYKEYEIADKAWDIALLYAKTQALAKFGSSNEFYLSKIFKDLDYTYQIVH